jgi:hypothetical protein
MNWRKFINASLVDQNLVAWYKNTCLAIDNAHDLHRLYAEAAAYKSDKSTAEADIAYLRYEIACKDLYPLLQQYLRVIKDQLSQINIGFKSKRKAGRTKNHDYIHLNNEIAAAELFSEGCELYFQYSRNTKDFFSGIIAAYENFENIEGLKRVYTVEIHGRVLQDPVLWCMTKDEALAVAAEYNEDHAQGGARAIINPDYESRLKAETRSKN